MLQVLRSPAWPARRDEAAAVRQPARTVPAMGVPAEPVTAGGRVWLDARGIIDRAVASLTNRQGMTDREAFRWLQRTAVDHRSSVRAVAWLVIAGRPARTATSSTGHDNAQATMVPDHQAPPPPAVSPRRGSSPCRPGSLGGPE